MYKKILVPTDGSDTGGKVIPHAVALAKSCGASVVGINVTDPYPYSGLAETVPITADQYRVHVTQLAEDVSSPCRTPARPLIWPSSPSLPKTSTPGKRCSTWPRTAVAIWW